MSERTFEALEPIKLRPCYCGPNECIHPSNLRGPFQCQIEAPLTKLRAALQALAQEMREGRWPLSTSEVHKFADRLDRLARPDAQKDGVN